MRTILTAVLAAAVTSPAFAQQSVGRLGPFTLTSAEVRQLVDAESPEARARMAASPELLDRAVRTELVRRALLAEAEGKGWDKRPEIAARIERARLQVVVTTYVGDLVRPPADYPTEAEVRAFYDANRASLLLPRRYRLAQIYLARPAGGDQAAIDAAAKRADELAGKAHAPGADFAALARESSQHADSAARGGELGWVAEGNLAPEIQPAVTRLAKGAVSEPVLTARGWHVMKLLDVAEPSPATLEQARTTIVNTLRLRRARELERAYLDALLAKSPISLDEAELAKLRESLR
jgi:peptidylprolyl isomerase